MDPDIASVHGHFRVYKFLTEYKSIGKCVGVPMKRMGNTIGRGCCSTGEEMSAHRLHDEQHQHEMLYYSGCLVTVPERRVILKADTVPHLQDVVGIYMFLNSCKASITFRTPE